VLHEKDSLIFYDEDVEEQDELDEMEEDFKDAELESPVDIKYICYPCFVLNVV
jgi:hypothetical protein